MYTLFSYIIKTISIKSENDLQFGMVGVLDRVFSSYQRNCAMVTILDNSIHV